MPTSTGSENRRSPVEVGSLSYCWWFINGLVNLYKLPTSTGDRWISEAPTVRMQTTNLRRLGPTVKVNDLKCHMLWNSHHMLRSSRSLVSHWTRWGCWCMLFNFWWGVVYSTTVLVNWWFGSRWSDTPKVTIPFLRGSLEKNRDHRAPNHQLTISWYMFHGEIWHTYCKWIIRSGILKD